MDRDNSPPILPRILIRSARHRRNFSLPLLLSFTVEQFCRNKRRPRGRFLGLPGNIGRSMVKRGAYRGCIGYKASVCPLERGRSLWTGEFSNWFIGEGGGKAWCIDREAFERFSRSVCFPRDDSKWSRRMKIFFFSVWFSFDDYISVDKVGARWVSIESVRKEDMRRMNNTSMR